jgi:hypothetical protein
LVESNDAGFFEAVHASADLEIDETIVGDVNVVAGVIPDFLWDDGGEDADVLVVLHGCA